MKRNFILATVVALMLVAGVVVTASAQGAQPATPAAAGACANGNWVDANNDGVCDNAPRDGSGTQYGRQNGQGMNQANGQGQGQGANFVDQNNDGVCDNFVDANGDGQCDNCGGGQQGARSGQGMQGRGIRGGQGWSAQGQP